MIMELAHLPMELLEHQPAKQTVQLYCQSFSDVMEVERLLAATAPGAVGRAMLTGGAEKMRLCRRRHAGTVVDMASACNLLKKQYNISLDEVKCSLSTAVQYFLDRLYISRISILMLMNQHLAVYGHERSPPGNMGVINPRTDIRFI